MTFDGVSIWTFHWVLAQDEGHEASQLGRTLVHLEVFSDDFGEFFLVFDIKGVLACEEFMGQRTDSPDINLLVVVLSTKDFRRKVKRRTAQSSSKLPRTVNRPSEITYLSHSLNLI